MSTTATRLITLIMLLQRRPNQKAADLAEKLGVSVRTMARPIRTDVKAAMKVWIEFQCSDFVALSENEFAASPAFLAEQAPLIEQRANAPTENRAGRREP